MGTLKGKGYSNSTEISESVNRMQEGKKTPVAFIVKIINTTKYSTG
jgi:hypothetical protein